MDMWITACLQPGPGGPVPVAQPLIVDCNQQLCEMFGASRDLLIGQSFQVLYPSADEYERLGARMAPILNARGHYADDRIMNALTGGSRASCSGAM
jgi:PAS domain-containing protein